MEMTDGEHQRTMLTAPHLDFARVLLDQVKPNPTADETVRLLYQATLAELHRTERVDMQHSESDSVAGERLEHLRSASKGVLGALKQNDRASLVTFSHIVTQRSELTTDIESVRSALDEAEGSGATALVDGIYASMLVGEAEPGRTLIIVFSDGVDTASWLSPAALMDTARRSEAVVYSVSTETDESSYLRELSRATGGGLLEVESTRDLNAVFLRIFNEFRYRYLVSYSPSGVDDGGWHRLEVNVKRKGATVKARPGYQKGS